MAEAHHADWLTVKPVRDATGHLVPSVIWGEFEYSKHIASLAGSLSRCAMNIDTILQLSKGTEYVDREKFLALIEEAGKLITDTRPIQVCQRCYHGGKGFQTACACKGLGWLPLFASTHRDIVALTKADKRLKARRRKKRQQYLERLRAFREAGDFSESAIAKLPSAVRWLARTFAEVQESSVLDLRGFRRPARRRRRPAQPESPPTSPETNLDA